MDASLSSTSFNFPLHNVFDSITPGELPHVMSVLEVSPVAHVTVHSERAELLHLTSREVLENPMADDASALLSDVVEHDRSSPRELEESPKGSHESEHNRSSPRELEESSKGPNEGAPHTSHIEHHEVHEVSVGVD